MSKFMKKVLLVIALLALIFTASSCAQPEQERARERETTTTEARTFTNQDYEEMLENPEEFEGRQGTVYGRVFNVVEGSHVQIFIDLDDERQFVLRTESAGGVRKGDFVKAQGEFTGIETFTNPLGGEVSAPFVDLRSIEEIDPFDALNFMEPAFKTVEVNKTINQQGFSVTLVRVRFAEERTRILLGVRNGTSEPATLSVLSAMAVQGENQFEAESVFGFPELQSDYQPDTADEGIIFFEPLDADARKARFIIDWSSEDFDIETKPFVFDVNW
ncbi:MAG: hypothetical protein AB1743_10760 [Actinomycetota bacterium]